MQSQDTSPTKTESKGTAVSRSLKDLEITKENTAEEIKSSRNQGENLK